VTSPQQPRKSSSGGWIILVILVLLGIGSCHEVMQVTQCNTLTQQCTQTDYPITTTSP
jgi:hypothetical protein